MAEFGSTIAVEVNPVIDAGAYSASDVVSDVLTFNFGDTPGLVLKSLKIVDDDNVKPAGTLWLFRSPPTTFAKNAAFAPVLADLRRLVARIAVADGDWSTVNSNGVAQVAVNDRNDADAGTLYGYYVVSGTPSFSSTAALYFELTAWRN